MHFDQLKRREFMTLLGCTAAAWPLAARAQQAGKLPTIGFAGSDAAFFSPWTAAFAGRLRELGWIEGRTITIEYRWSEGRPERVAAIAAEFVGLNVDVIVTAGGRCHHIQAGDIGDPHRLRGCNRPARLRPGRQPCATGR
jgi:putative tryptophan/tyrosine transport system substrate-binding protein